MCKQHVDIKGAQVGTQKALGAWVGIQQHFGFRSDSLFLCGFGQSYINSMTDSFAMGAFVVACMWVLCALRCLRKAITKAFITTLNHEEKVDIYKYIHKTVFKDGKSCDQESSLWLLISDDEDDQTPARDAPCTHAHTTTRGSNGDWRRLSCADCGELLKVWPADTNKRVKKQKPVKTGARAACAETEWDEYGKYIARKLCTVCFSSGAFMFLMWLWLEPASEKNVVVLERVGFWVNGLGGTVVSRRAGSANCRGLWGCVLCVYKFLHAYMTYISIYIYMCVCVCTYF